MNIRIFSVAVAAGLLLSASAFAQTSGNTSGTAAGTNATPSSAVQKEQQGRSAGSSDASAQGGGPGVEGPAGSKNGPPQKSNKHKE